MLKLRIEGPREEIYKYLDRIQADESIVVFDISKCYPNHGVSIYDRCFVELEIKEEKEGK